MTTTEPKRPGNEFAIVAREDAGLAYEVVSLWRGTQPAPKAFLGHAQAQHYADDLNATAHEMYPQGDARGVRDPAVVAPVDLQADVAFVIYEVHSGAIVATARTREDAQEELEEVRLFNPARATDTTAPPSGSPEPRSGA